MSAHTPLGGLRISCLTTTFLIVGSVWLTFGDVASAAEKSTPAAVASQPASKDTTARTTASDDDAQADAGEVGAVTKALTRLYRISRAQPRQSGPTPRESDRPEVQRSTRSGRAPYRRPVAGGEERFSTDDGESNRMGYQHTDAIRNGVSELPIGDDLRQPPTDDYIRAEPPLGAPLDRESSLTASRWGPYPDYAYGSPYYSRGPRLSDRKRDWVEYRYFDGRPSAYGYGRYSREYGLDDNQAGEYFRFGFLEGYDRGRFEGQADERTQSVLAHAGTHLSRGLAAFRAGKYREAARYFRLAADTNQGDPASRIYAAHALFAIGRYEEGVKYLRRAFELQPKIAMLIYDMRDDYGQRGQFDEQLAALEKASAMDPRNMDRLVMLAYAYQYSQQPDKAFDALSRARTIDRRDPLVSLLYANSDAPDIAVESSK